MERNVTDWTDPRLEHQVPRVERMLQFFEYAHLKPELQEISKPFSEMAHWIEHTLPSNPERTVALRKLLEAKDAAVRAAIYKGP
jgi:hypothetical protein